MTEPVFYLAQVNIARVRAPLTDPLMADFINGLERINGLADAAPGFIWRLKTESGDATSIRAFGDDRIIVNMSVWESVDALFQFAYASDHVDFFRRRAEWFEKMSVPSVVMWWIRAGHTPTTAEAEQKHTHLIEHGATPQAFTFKQRFTVEDMLKASESV